MAIETVAISKELGKKYKSDLDDTNFFVHYYETLSDEDHLYFVMEFMQGGELFAVLKRQLGMRVDSI